MKKEEWLLIAKKMERSCKAHSRGRFESNECIPFESFSAEQMKIVKFYFERGFYTGYRRAMKEFRK